MNSPIRYMKLIRKLFKNPTSFLLDSKIPLYKEVGTLFFSKNNFFNINDYKSIKKLSYSSAQKAALKKKKWGKECNNAKFLVHLHLYYDDQIDYFLNKILNICCKFDLYVTLNKHNKSIEDKIFKKFSDAKIIYVENAGYDIWPFIKVLQSVNISDYDFILKLHTKRKLDKTKIINNKQYAGFELRNSLVEPLIGSKKIFKDVLALLYDNCKIGIIGNADLFRNIRDDIYRDFVIANYDLKNLGIKTDNFCFVCGSMFIIRACHLDNFYIKSLNVGMFKSVNKSNTGGTFAHSIERYYGALIENDRQTLAGAINFKTELKRILKRKLFSFYIDENDFIFNLLFIQFKINLKKRALKKELSDLKNILTLKDSKYFDEKYYMTTYKDSLYDKRISPQEHYYKIGWQLGFNPSEYFITDSYIMLNPSCTINPLLHYINSGHSTYVKLKNTPANEIISKNIKNKNRKTKVIYTCLVGDSYCDLANHSYINEEYDYICFTDRSSLKNMAYYGAWEIRPIDNFYRDNTRTNRYYKINPHIFLQEYDESIYVDSNINIRTKYIFDIIREKKSTLLVPYHFLRNCLYKEANEVVKAKKDSKEAVAKTIAFIKSKGFPANYGLTENNIIYRKHNDQRIIGLMTDWWEMIKDFSRRDQLSFSYVLWKNNFKIKDIAIDNARSDLMNFDFYKHAQNINYTFAENIGVNNPYCDLLTKMRDEKIKIISFDLFDTLISRSVLKPSDVFLLLGSYAFEISDGSIKDFSKIRTSAERLCRKNSQQEEITLCEIYNYINKVYEINLNMLDNIMAREIAIELSIVYARKTGIMLYNLAKLSGKKIILCTDTYLSRDVISKILEKFNYKFDRLYISSELRQRKHTGTLFSSVLDTLNINPYEMLHIGDNRESDISQAMAKGINTFLIEKSTEAARKSLAYGTILEKNAAKLQGYAPSALLGLIFKKIFDGKQTLQKNTTLFNGLHYNIGYCALGPIVIAFALWILRNNNNNNYDAILFLSREGDIIKRVFDILSNGKIKSIYLLTSRRASRVASLFNKEDILSLGLSPYLDGAELITLLGKRFGITEEHLLNIDIKKFGFDSTYQKVDNSPYTHDNLLKLLTQLSDIILKHAAIERKNYQTYLNSKISDYNNIALVDIGWQGHIHGAISDLIKKKITGLYYATFHGAKLYESLGQKIYSFAGEFINDKDHSAIAKYLTIAEYIFCSSAKTLINFDNNIEPVFLEETNYAYRKKIITQIHNGCIAFAKDFYTQTGNYMQNIYIDNMISELVFSEFMSTPSNEDANLLHGQFFEDYFDGVTNKKTHIK